MRNSDELTIGKTYPTLFQISIPYKTIQTLFSEHVTLYFAFLSDHLPMHICEKHFDLSNQFETILSFPLNYFNLVRRQPTVGFAWVSRGFLWCGRKSKSILLRHFVFFIVALVIIFQSNCTSLHYFDNVIIFLNKMIALN